MGAWNPSTDSRSYKRRHLEAALKKNGRCVLCPPHAGENAGYSRSCKTSSRRGAKKPVKARRSCATQAARAAKGGE